MMPYNSLEWLIWKILSWGVWGKKYYFRSPNIFWVMCSRSQSHIRGAPKNLINLRNMHEFWHITGLFTWYSLFYQAESSFLERSWSPLSNGVSNFLFVPSVCSEKIQQTQGPMRFGCPPVSWSSFHHHAAINILDTYYHGWRNVAAHTCIIMLFNLLWDY